MRTKLRSKFTLLFMTFAVVMLAFPAMVLAQDAGGAGGTSATPTIQSDKDDYAPGELVTLTGSGWQPGESVHINVNDTYGATWSRNVDVIADASGNITDSFNLPNSFVSDYDVTATGAQSGTVRTTFTDSIPTAVSVSPASQTVTQGGSTTYSVNVTMGGNNTACTITLSAVGLPNGATATFTNSPNATTASYTSTMTVNTTAATPAAAHTLSVDASKPGGCNGAAAVVSSNQVTLNVNSAVTSTSVSDITATDSTFGGTTNLSAKVSPLNAPGSVEFFVNGSSAGSGTYDQSTGVATLSNYTHGLNASNTAYSVKAVFTPSGSSHSSSQATNASALTVGKASSTTDVTCTAGPFTYTGSAHTPCSVSVTGAGGLNLSPNPDYSNNVGAGTATASYTYAGDANHNGSNDSENFTIDKASSTTDVTCTAGPFTYDGNPITPCSASVTGAGGLNLSPAVSYTNNTGAGTATASYTYAGDANHNGSNDSENFTINKASSTTTVNCPASVTYTGSAVTPCSASVTGAGGLNQSLTVSYTNNTDAGTATASASYTGDANHLSSSDSKNFTITFNFTGFASPVDNNNVLNSAKAGQAIPLKWRLTDASGNPVTNLLSTDVKVSVANLNCDRTITADQVEEYAAGSSGLQNLGNGYYQFNWKTPTNYANSCKTMTLDLGEGTLTTPHTALFKFTK